MKILLRGGQTTMHSFRMLRQVIKHLFKVGFIVMLAISFYSLKGRVSLYDLKVYAIYIYSKFLISLNLLNTKVNITNAAGESGTHLTSDIVNNAGVLNVFHNTNQQAINALGRSAQYGLIAVIILFLIFMAKGFFLNKKRILRGKAIVSPAQLRSKVIIHNVIKAIMSPKYYILGAINFFKLNFNYFSSIRLANIPYPSHSEKTHTLVTGAVGTGKTVLISNLIKQVRGKGQKAIIYDYMGVYTERFYDPSRGDILFNPLDSRTPNWSLVNECQKSSDFDSIAKAFIPDKNSGDPYWENAARAVFAESIKYLKLQGSLSNQALKDIFFSPDDQVFEKIIESSGILQKILPKDAERTTGSILSIMITYLKSLQYLSDSDEEYFSIKNWIADDSKTGFLIVSSKADQHESLKPLISALLEVSINSLLSLKQNRSRRVWVFLDELPSMHFIPSLQPGLAQARQFGGSFVLTVQLMAQLRSIYGKDLSQAVSGVCRNRVIFATPDEETASWCSDSLGKIETEETKESASYGSHEMRDGINLSKQIQTKALILPTQIMNLEDLSCYIRFSNGFPACLNKLKYENYSQISEKFIENKTVNQVIGAANRDENITEITIPLIEEMPDEDPLLLSEEEISDDDLEEGSDEESSNNKPFILLKPNFD